MKKNIALIVDVENWAFGNIAKQVKEHLGDAYSIKIIPMESINGNIVKCMLLCQDCDLIHFFWRGYVDLFNKKYAKEYIENLGMTLDEFLEMFVRNKIVTTAIYDHSFLAGEDFDMTKRIISFVDHYYTSSQKLFNIYSKIKVSKKPSGVLTDGVDPKKFFPKDLERFINIKKREIVIGWVGNSKWGEDGKDFKGVNTIIKPAIEELRREGYAIKMYFADRNERMIPHDEMNNYYANIDIYVCASFEEGTPNPILESMACGIPVITTDVGIVRQAFGPKQLNYILEERSIDCLKDKLKEIIKKPSILKELSKENLSKIAKWSWDVKVENFKEFFDMCLEKND